MKNHISHPNIKITESVLDEDLRDALLGGDLSEWVDREVLPVG